MATTASDRYEQISPRAALYSAPNGDRTVGKLYQRIQEARRRTGLSQQALASELGVSRSALAQWEMVNGTRPSVEHLVALARRSGLHFEYLATGRGAKVHGAPALDHDEDNYAQLTHQQRTLLMAFDALSPRQRAGLLELITPRTRPRGGGA